MTTTREDEIAAHRATVAKHELAGIIADRYALARVIIDGAKSRRPRLRQAIARVGDTLETAIDRLAKARIT
jgi:hypothetical protein